MCLLLKNWQGRLLKPTLLTLLFTALTGCEKVALLDPQGPIGVEIRDLIYLSVAVMLIVVIPVLIMSVWIPIKYRASNKNAEYKPDWEHSNKIEAVVWAVPCLIILALAIVTYTSSHALDPRKPLVSDKPTLRIHVVALDWKWLFIYPEQEIASVNEVAIPVDVPVEFLITSDTVMNSFFIPRLGGQIYAMAGMENQLHLMASKAGVYRGMSANYSGFGFSGMKFKTLALNESAFNQWVNKVKNAPVELSDDAYHHLIEKTKDHPVEYFSRVNPLMFNHIIEKYTGPQNVE